MGWTPAKQRIKTALEEKGKELPTEFIAPDLLPGLDFYTEAYADLSTMRNYAGGPIPYDKLVTYAVSASVGNREFPIFRALIMALDRAERDWHEARKPKPPPTPTQRRR